MRTCFSGSCWELGKGDGGRGTADGEEAEEEKRKKGSLAS